MRATWSGLEPGPNGTSALSGWLGQAWAWAAAIGASAARASATALAARVKGLCMVVSRVLHGIEVGLFIGDEGRHHGAVGGVDHLLQIGEALVVALGQAARLFKPRPGAPGALTW